MEDNFASICIVKMINAYNNKCLLEHNGKDTCTLIHVNEFVILYSKYFILFGRSRLSLPYFLLSSLLLIH